MNRGAIALALVAALGLGAACKGKKSQAKQGTGSAGQAAPTPPPLPPGTPPPLRPATEPDLEYEARRALLLKRGDPNMMKDAPVLQTTAPDIKPQELIKPISKDEVMIGTIKLNLAKGRAELPAKVSELSNPLEYLAVAESGKAYESLFTVKTTSIELRLALSMMGYEGTIPAEGGKVTPPTPTDSVQIFAVVAGKERPINAYLIDRRTKKAPVEHPWQVVGFRPADKDQSLLTKDFITLVERDYFAPVRIPVDPGNPYTGPDQGYGANTKLLPPKGGDVLLVIKRRPDAPEIPPGVLDMMNPSMPPGMPGMPGMPTSPTRRP